MCGTFSAGENHPSAIAPDPGKAFNRRETGLSQFISSGSMPPEILISVQSSSLQEEH